jgi:DtxR family Mn-dependent transcriptional regulator
LASLTVENYIKNIYMLQSDATDKTAATGQIAAAMGVSPGTVTSMLKTLSDGNLATYTPYEGVRLTDAGQALALRVIRRHRLIELFLARTLDLSWDEVHEEAEHMEHAVSDRLVDRIDAWLGHPAVDPHGDPIPHRDGSPRKGIGVTLDEMPVGRKVKLVRVLDQSPEFLRFLSDAGLPLEAEAFIIANQPEAGIVTLDVEKRSVPLSRNAARMILVVDA